MRHRSNSDRFVSAPTFDRYDLPFRRSAQRDGVSILRRANASSLGKIACVLRSRHWRRCSPNCFISNAVLFKRKLALVLGKLASLCGSMEHFVRNVGGNFILPPRETASKRLVDRVYGCLSSRRSRLGGATVLEFGSCLHSSVHCDVVS